MTSILDQNPYFLGRTPNLDDKHDRAILEAGGFYALKKRGNSDDVASYWAMHHAGRKLARMFSYPLSIEVSLEFLVRKGFSRDKNSASLLLFNLPSYTFDLGARLAPLASVAESFRKRALTPVSYRAIGKLDFVQVPGQKVEFLCATEDTPIAFGTEHVDLAPFDGYRFNISRLDNSPENMRHSLPEE